MANEKLIRASDARRAILKEDPKLAYCIDDIPGVDAVEVVKKPLRVDITTDDFTSKDLAKEKGYYRKHYFCPSCDIEIGHKTFDKHRQFGQGTVLHSNIFPNYCPNCGADMRGEQDGK